MIAETTENILPTLKRGQKHPSDRSINFIDRAITPELVAETGGDEIWIVGDMPETRLVRPQVMALAAAGWTVEKYMAELRTATISRDGRTVTIRAASRWFGEERDVRVIRAAYKRLHTLLQWSFNDSRADKRANWAHVWPTPTQTGLELLRGTLPFGKEYPVLPQEIRDRITHNSGQGRRELTTAKDGRNYGLKTLPGLHEIDARWMYAACVRDLPTGPAFHEMIPAHMVRKLDLHYQPHKPAFYLVHARVPGDWSHIGLLPTRDGEHTRYPWKPGEAFVSFCTGAELEIALKYGWVLSIHERIVWPERSSDPAKTWITKLRTLRAEEEENAANGEQDAALVARAVRRLVLDAIGGWHTSERLEEGFVPYGASDAVMIPTGAVPMPRGDGIAWTRTAPIVTEFTHPEWSAMVWGRARARLVKEALKYDPSWIVALRTDALWTSDAFMNSEYWFSEGQPGTFRVKSSLYKKVAAPRSEAAFLALARKARGADLEEDE